jgi:hypothetical protein
VLTLQGFVCPCCAAAEAAKRRVLELEAENTRQRVALKARSDEAATAQRKLRELASRVSFATQKVTACDAEDAQAQPWMSFHFQAVACIHQSVSCYNCVSVVALARRALWQHRRQLAAVCWRCANSAASSVTCNRCRRCAAALHSRHAAHQGLLRSSSRHSARPPAAPQPAPPQGPHPAHPLGDPRATCAMLHCPHHGQHGTA